MVCSLKFTTKCIEDIKGGLDGGAVDLFTYRGVSYDVHHIAITRAIQYYSIQHKDIGICMMKIGQAITVLLLTFIRFAACFLRVCYYTNWSQYRPDGGKFVPENINPALCSHIIYAFAKLDGNKLTAYESNDDRTMWSIGMYAKINNLKKQHPHLKTLLAVGGWNAGSLPFSNMAFTAQSRQEFVNHTQHYLRERNFDGLDIDWEYPTQRGGRPEDKQNFVLLLKDLATAFEQDAYHTGRPKLILSAAVPAGQENIDSGFDIPKVARSLDFINVMTYDLHGSWEPKTGHNSPLFPRRSETGPDVNLNIEWALNYWSRKGAPKHKLIVGLGFYGRSFKLENPLNNGLGATSIGAGRMGNYTKEDGFMAYYEVCQELANGAVRVWDNEHMVPYMYKNDIWVGYDDEQSVREKVKWTKKQGYGGMMVWSMALDDFTGTICNNGPYPLLTAINNELQQTAPPETLQFIDPTIGDGSAVSLGGSGITPPTTILTNPPLPQAFEHRPIDGHSHQVHSSPLLTNISGIDLQQLNSLPHISIIDHHPAGTVHSSTLKTTPKPSSAIQAGPADTSQASLAELISQLIHAPANHQNSGHHSQIAGVADIVNAQVPTMATPNPAPTGSVFQEVIPPAAPPPSAPILTDLGNPLPPPSTLQEGALHSVDTVPDLHIAKNPSFNSAVGTLTALGNIGVLPAVGRLGGSHHRDHLSDLPNISISSSSNSNSSSTSSSSSSQSKSRNVSIDIPGQPPGRLNLQDVLKSGRTNLPISLLESAETLPIDPLLDLTPGSGIPGNSIMSLLDGGVPTTQTIELPSGSVGTVIPVSQNDNLAQVLSSLGVQLPTAGSVLLPDAPTVLTPERILDELTIGNILQSQISNVQPAIQRRPLAPIRQNLPLPSIQRQRLPERPRILQRQTRVRTRPVVNTMRTPAVSIATSPRRRTISLADLRRLLERRRIAQALRTSQPRQSLRRNRIANIRTPQLLLNRLRRPTLSQQRPALSQQRNIRPAVSRQRLQQVRLSRPRVRTQLQQRPTLVRRPRIRSTQSRNALTLLNSGDLPPRLQRVFSSSRSSSVPLSLLI